MLLLATVFLLQGTTRDSGLVAAALAAARHDPLEVFDSVSGSPEIRGTALLDVDGDSRPEVFLWIDPSFRQTPTVVVYRAKPDGPPTRLREGLAPGPLIPVSGRLGDPHTLGAAVDMYPEPLGEPYDTAQFIETALALEMAVVRYRTFVHADLRTGYAGYVDLGERGLPPADTVDCAAFEFSPVLDLRAGRLTAEDPARYLIALTSSEATVYEFHGLGYLDTLRKRAWAVPRPPSSRGLVIDRNGIVGFAMTDGSTAPIRVHR